MALTVSLHQQALHDASKAAMMAANHPRYSSRWVYASGGQISTPTFRAARTKEEEPVIPSLHVFESLRGSMDASSDAIPTVGECATHLELLEVFHTLRVKVLQSEELDHTFGIHPNPKIVWRRTGYGQRQEVKLKDTSFASRREEKWSLFLSLAVARFRIWIIKADSALSNAARGSEGGGSKVDAVMSSSLQEFPPLDVLMVWHSYLLNPKDYQAFCKDLSVKTITQLSFPWSTIESIDPSDWSFTTPKNSQNWLKKVAKLEPDLFAYLRSVAHSSTRTKALLSANRSPSSLPPSENLRVVQIVQDSPVVNGEAPFLECWEAAIRDQKANKPFIDAVQRQGSFVDKMHAQLWIRSPAVEGTLQRAIDRYLKFLKLLKFYPNTMLVPTLDIDLVWHTHQCSPHQYRNASIERTGRFINHDDKLARSVLDDGEETTRQLFRTRFGQEYVICHCWDCETALSVLSRDKREVQGELDMENVTEEIFMDVAYHRAVELARRERIPLPARHSPQE